MPRGTSQTVPANFDYASLYLKRVLLPFWIFRHFFLAWYFVFYIIAIIAFAAADGLENRGSLIAIAVVVLVIVIACSAADLYTIFMFIRRKLKPLVFLVINAVETTVWLVLFALTASGVLRRRTRVYNDNEQDGYYSNRTRASSSPFTWLLSLLLVLSFAGLLIYAIVVYVRFRKTASRGEYAAPGASASPVALHGADAPEAYETPMQAQYPGGGVAEYYRPNVPKNGSHESGAAGQQYQSRDFTAAARGLSMDYQGEYYAPAAGSTSKLPNMEAIELSAQPERRNGR